MDSGGTYQSGNFGIQLEALEFGQIQTISGGGITVEMIAEAAALPPDIHVGKVAGNVSLNLRALGGRIDLTNVRVMEIRPSRNGYRVPSDLRQRMLFDVVLQFESFRTWPTASFDLGLWLQIRRARVPRI